MTQLEKYSLIRLSENDLEAIISLFRLHFLSEDRLWIFGSRVDRKKKGGDIDLYIETHAHTVQEAFQRELNFIGDVEEKIGEQKIDTVLNMLNKPYPLLIHEIAKTQGVQIV